MTGCNAAVIERAIGGDEAAFERLVASYRVPLYSLCFRMLGEVGEAEDAVQEIFLRVYLHLHNYDPQREFRAWLFVAATRFCMTRLRRRRLAWQPWDAEHDHLGVLNIETAPDPEQTVVQAEDEGETQALLARLAWKDRAVVVMHYWDDMTYADMAAATGTSPGAVKSRMHRARGVLAGVLRRKARSLGCLPAAN